MHAFIVYIDFIWVSEELLFILIRLLIILCTTLHPQIRIKQLN